VHYMLSAVMFTRGDSHLYASASGKRTGKPPLRALDRSVKALGHRTW
jgi:hypothetical protein